MIRKILYALIVILVVIQFFKPARNSGETNGKAAINNVYAVPANVEGILKKSCNDCHTNSTIYPWYANIQPVAWWLADHINEGKRKLNLSEFGNYTLKKQNHKLEELVESQNDQWMPINSYTFAHRNARLSDAERKELIDWANQLRKEIQSKM